MGLKIIFLILYFGMKEFLPAIGTSWDFNDPYFSFIQNVLLLIIAGALFKKELLLKFKKIKWKKAVLSSILTFLMMMLTYVLIVIIFSIPSLRFHQYPSNIFFIVEAVLVVPFIEEMAYRYCFISESASKGIKIVLLFLSAMFFAYAHAAAVEYNAILLIPFFVLGMTTGGLLLVKKNIWYSIFAHFFYNLAMLLISFTSI